MILVFKAFLAGLIYSAPLGPSAALAARSMLLGETKQAMMIAIGAFLAEVSATLLTISGFGFLTHSLAQTHMYFGAGFLTLIIGLFVFFSKPPDPHATSHGENDAPVQKRITYLLAGFSITFLNPMSFIGAALLFASLGIHFAYGIPYNTLLALVMFCGCVTWWSLILSTLYTLKKRVSRNFMQRLNHGVGLVLISLAGYAFFSGWQLVYTS